MTAMKPRGLHDKLAQIRGALNGKIVKSGEHTQGGPKYKFVEALEVGRLFVEEASALGVTMLPGEMTVLDIRESITKKQHVVTIGVAWDIVDSESGETASVYSIGQGADNSDKAAPKAQTNAMKYGILMVLQAAGDDPEKDEPEPPYKRAARRTATKRQASVSTDEPDGADALTGANDEDEVLPRPRRKPRRVDPEPRPGVAMASADLKAKIRARQHEVGLDDAQFKLLGRHFTGKDSSVEWTEANAEKVLAQLDKESVVAMFMEVKGEYVPDDADGSYPGPGGE